MAVGFPFNVKKSGPRCQEFSSRSKAASGRAAQGALATRCKLEPGCNHPSLHASAALLLMGERRSGGVVISSIKGEALAWDTILVRVDVFVKDKSVCTVDEMAQDRSRSEGSE